MNRYPWWKYLIIAVALLIGLIYSLPNVFGEAPAVQLSSGKATLKLDQSAVERVRTVLKEAGLDADFVELDGTSVRARFKDTDSQLKARDALSRSFNPDAQDPSYIVALNLVSRSPQWLRNLHAQPMYLGLDLRGGVHFLMQVDMKGALTQRLETVTSDARTLLRDKDVRHSGIRREGDTIVVRLRDEATRTAARNALSDSLTDLSWQDAQEGGEGSDLTLVGTLSPQAAKAIQDQAIALFPDEVVGWKVGGVPPAQQPALVRGVYFTSGTQEGSPIDRMMGTLSRTFGLDRAMVAPRAGSGKSFFLLRLVREVVFPVKNLAGLNLAQERRQVAHRPEALAQAGFLRGGSASGHLHRASNRCDGRHSDGHHSGDRHSGRDCRASGDHRGACGPSSGGRSLRLQRRAMRPGCS